MTTRQLNMLREHLRGRMADLARLAERVDVLRTESCADPVDTVQSENTLDLAVRALNTDWATKRAVRAALERIESGEYGLCETCGRAINAKRLKAIPWATQCVACQQATEELEDKKDPSVYPVGK